MEQPRYTHDCDVCQFVGTIGPFDIYSCYGLVARFGNDGPEYLSGAGTTLQWLIDHSSEYEGE